MHPIEIDPILKLAKNNLRSSKVPEAEQMYARVLKEQPQCAEALHFLGLAAMQRGKLDQALELVRRSIEIEPARADYHNNLATLLGRMNAAVEALGGDAAGQRLALADGPGGYAVVSDDAIVQTAEAGRLARSDRADDGGAGGARQIS
jgi:tetratricopeptide (TPR) repeat protein